MKRRDEFEDDGRIVADMSDLEGVGLFGRRRTLASRGGRRNAGREDTSENSGMSGSETGRNPWEDMPFTWQERMRYIFMALGAAFLIGAVLLGGVAVVIWLITLYD